MKNTFHGLQKGATRFSLLCLLLSLLLIFTACELPFDFSGLGGGGNDGTTVEGTYDGPAFVTLNENTPTFTAGELTVVAYETYGNLDSLGRCTTVIACCGQELMPAKGEERGSISSVKPSGWVQASYDFVDGGYLYNRCHLIGWQLTAENANKKNLITGTKYLNIEGMLPFENMIADYIRETDNHVMYRVTPIYNGNNLLPSGVQMEAYSVEDEGDGICFNIFCYNIQPGVTIDYATGKSHASNGDMKLPAIPDALKPDSVPDFSTDVGGGSADSGNTETGGGSTVGGAGGEAGQTATYILNTNTKRIHLPSCSSAADMAEHNKKEHTGDITELLAQGYRTCSVCMK